MVSDMVIDVLKESDLYKIMGVSADAEMTEINKAYKVLAKKFHPDLHSLSSQSDKDTTSQIFSKITTAYNTLKDTDKRKIYDYDRRLKQEYEKTLNSTTFSFSKPDGTGVNININNSTNATTPKRGAAASEETKNEQAEKMYNSAMEKYKTGNIDAAILDLQTAVVLARIAKYHSCLGLFMNEKGWTGYAQSHFKSALSIDPNDKLALKNYINPLAAKEQETKKVLVSKEKSLIEKIKGFFAKLFSSAKD